MFCGPVAMRRRADRDYARALLLAKLIHFVSALVLATRQAARRASAGRGRSAPHRRPIRRRRAPRLTSYRTPVPTPPLASPARLGRGGGHAAFPEGARSRPPASRRGPPPDVSVRRARPQKRPGRDAASPRRESDARWACGRAHGGRARTDPEPPRLIPPRVRSDRARSELARAGTTRRRARRPPAIMIRRRPGQLPTVEGPAAQGVGCRARAGRGRGGGRRAGPGAGGGWGGSAPGQGPRRQVRLAAGLGQPEISDRITVPA